MSVSVGVIHPNIGEDGRWIDDFVDPGAGYTFKKYSPRETGTSWHQRGASTPFREWLDYFGQSLRAVRGGHEVVVANFPQLTFAACVWKVVTFRRRMHVVGWSFNFGPSARSTVKRVLGRVFRTASLLVTHSRAEIDLYHKAFGLPRSLFRFVPLQRGELMVEPSGRTDEYVIAMGSAGRDYKTLIDVFRHRDDTLLVIAKPSSLAGLEIPENVEVRSGLSLDECWSLAADAKAMVLPVAETGSAAGQVTFLAALQLRVPLVVTRCPGTEDYLPGEGEALLVEPFDAAGMDAALTRILSDPCLAGEIADAGHKLWREKYSDEAAAKNLVGVLDVVTGSGQTHAT